MSFLITLAIQLLAAAIRLNYHCMETQRPREEILLMRRFNLFLRFLLKNEVIQLKIFIEKRLIPGLLGSLKLL